MGRSRGEAIFISRHSQLFSAKTKGWNGWYFNGHSQLNNLYMLALDAQLGPTNAVYQNPPSQEQIQASIFQLQLDAGLTCLFEFALPIS
jgi:hypothetical protein